MLSMIKPTPKTLPVASRTGNQEAQPDASAFPAEGHGGRGTAGGGGTPAAEAPSAAGTPAAEAPRGGATGTRRPG